MIFSLMFFLHQLGCHIKCHKDHVDREEDCIQECKGKRSVHPDKINLEKIIDIIYIYQFSFKDRHKLGTQSAQYAK